MLHFWTVTFPFDSIWLHKDISLPSAFWIISRYHDNTNSEILNDFMYFTILWRVKVSLAYVKDRMSDGKIKQYIVSDKISSNKAFLTWFQLLYDCCMSKGEGMSTVYILTSWVYWKLLNQWQYTFQFDLIFLPSHKNKLRFNWDKLSKLISKLVRFNQV